MERLQLMDLWVPVPKNGFVAGFVRLQRLSKPSWNHDVDPATS